MDKPQNKLHPYSLPIPGWNERRMTSAGFARVCKREGIMVKRTRLEDGILGMYTRRNGAPTIYIDSRLKGNDRTFTEFHELGHYFLHDGDKSVFKTWNPERSPLQQWAEVEADTVAIVALSPGFNFGWFLKITATSAARYNWKNRGTGKKRRPQVCPDN